MGTSNAVGEDENADGTSDDSDEEDDEDSQELEQLAAVAKKWKSSNTQSLGELLHGLLKYYVVDFDHCKYAITIRQSRPLPRSTREWGSNKLAVEDPYLTKNNLARTAGSDKVYEYLINCLKWTFLHMLQLNKRLKEFVKEITRGNIQELPTVELEGEKDRKDEGGLNKEWCNSMATIDDNKQEDIAEEEEEEEIEDDLNDGKNQGVNDEDVDGEDTETNLLEGEDKETATADAGGGEEKQPSRKSLRKQRYKFQIMKAIENLEIGEEEKCGYAFCEKDFKSLFNNYPVACLFCRRARHSALECPEEVVPKLKWNGRFPHSQCLDSLSHVLQTYMSQVMLSPDHEAQRKEIRDMILNDIHTYYPKASLELFGSSANQFGHCNSDLDLCLLMNEKYECEKVEIIEKLAKHLKTVSLYRNVSWIGSARVPIIKLFVNKWSMECDISMENCLALQNTKMLAAYSDIDYRVRVLGYTVKCFAKVCDMCDASTGSVSSYGYILMLIHFLQHYNLLPVLQELPLSTKPRSGPIIEGWNCYFFAQIADIHRFWRPDPNSERFSVAELWINFLLYYSKDFDWKHDVVTIRQKERLTKFEKSWTTKPMAIEDPFNHDHNLAQAVTSRMRTYIIKRFHNAVYYHHKPTMWRNMEEVMKKEELCGDYKPPKFIICEKCNRRNHKAADCPRNREQAQQISTGERTSEENKTREKPRQKPDFKSGTQDTLANKNKEQGKSKNEASSMESQKETGERNDEAQQLDQQTSSTGKTRSEIRQQLMLETGGSLEQLKKCHLELKRKAHSSKGTSLDKKTLRVCSDLIKKVKKDQNSQCDGDGIAGPQDDLQENTETIPTDTLEMPSSPPPTLTSYPPPTPITKASTTKSVTVLNKSTTPNKRDGSSKRHHKEEVSMRIVPNRGGGMHSGTIGTDTANKNTSRNTRQSAGRNKGGSTKTVSSPTVIIQPKVEQATPTVPPTLMSTVPYTSYPINVPNSPHQCPPLLQQSSPIRQPLLLGQPIPPQSHVHVIGTTQRPLLEHPPPPTHSLVGTPPSPGPLLEHHLSGPLPPPHHLIGRPLLEHPSSLPHHPMREGFPPTQHHHYGGRVVPPVPIRGGPVTSPAAIRPPQWIYHQSPRGQM